MSVRLTLNAACTEVVPEGQSNAPRGNQVDTARFGNDIVGEEPHPGNVIGAGNAERDQARCGLGIDLELGRHHNAVVQPHVVVVEGKRHAGQRPGRQAQREGS